MAVGIMSSPWLGGVVRPTIRPFPGTVPKFPSSVPVPPLTIPHEVIQAQTRGDAIAKPQTMAKDLTEENAKKRKKDCKCKASFQCQGSVSMQNRGESGLEYQLYIANLHAAPIVFTKSELSSTRYSVTEWKFGGVNDWDGLWTTACILIEAKGDYGFMKKIPGRLTKQISTWLNGQIQKHRVAVKPHQKISSSTGQKVKAQWHFQGKDEKDQLVKQAGPAVVSALKTDGVTFHHTAYTTEKERAEQKSNNQKEFESFCKNNPDFCA